VSAADYLTQLQIPQLSPSSTGYALSDGEAYPFFARTPPSDAWQNFALADVVEHLVKAERVATVNSEDAYGTASLQAFKDEANQRNLRVLASTSFAIGQTNFSSNLDALNRSGALVVVLFCPVADASRFISATQAAGLDDIVWVGSESVTLAVRNMVTGSSDQASRLRGFAGIGPSGAAGAAYTAFQSRLNAFQATVLGYGYCTAETDDDGRYLWAAEVPAWVAAVQPPPTVSSCLWASGDITNDFYAAFAYDAVYAMAYAIERTLAVAPFAPLDGTALMGQLLDTTFLGATGLVAFDKNGDRAAGISYEVFNVANMPTLPTMPMVGRWQQGTTWSSRFTSTWSSRFTSSASYVAADGRSSRATDFAGSNMLLPLAVMCENATAGSKRQREECDHIQHAVGAPAC
jgi:ABC-type branched-subunit amino acid transport system substrate-binding protein